MLNKLMYRRDEVASQMGVSRKTVDRMISRGDLHAVKIGRLTRINYQELARASKISGPTETVRDKRQD